jgi:hypothetical protein
MFFNASFNSRWCEYLRNNSVDQEDNNYGKNDVAEYLPAK